MFFYVNIFHVEVSVLVFVLCSFIVDEYHVIEMYLRDLWHRGARATCCSECTNMRLGVMTDNIYYRKYIELY